MTRAGKRMQSGKLFDRPSAYFAASKFIRIRPHSATPALFTARKPMAGSRPPH